MKNGWIKLHRRILEWEWWDDSKTVKLFIHILLTTNHANKKWRGIIIEKGQKLTSYAHLAKEANLSVQNVRTSLSKLKSTGELTIKTTTKYTLITVNNWIKYQVVTSKLTNDQQTTNKQLTTNKKDKNDKKLLHSEQSSQIQKVFNIFYDSINPNINYGNKTSRKAAEWLIKKYGLEKTLGTAEYACSVQGNKYAPKITTPYQLKEKMTDLMIYYKRNQSSGPTII